MKNIWLKALLVAAVGALLPGIAHSFRFEASESVSGNLDMQLTVGAGMRTQSWNPQLVGDPNVVPNANTGFSSNTDDGDLNYKKNNLYTTYVKFTPELLVKFPYDIKFMTRASFLYDFMADETERTELSPEAKRQIVYNAYLYDLWVSKDFNVGDQRARVRLGNQVVNWGESIFAIGGINATNALDFQKIQIPGTQLKEAVLPMPMISVASGLGGGFNLEGYYQFWWNRNRLPPVGSYFSVVDILGKGHQNAFFEGNPANPNFFSFGGLDPAADPTQTNTVPVTVLGEIKPSTQGQYGFALHYKPEGVSLDIGFYFMNYHDKMPVLNLRANGQLQWEYLENRKLYGVSANTSLGNWAVGWELSYRPKDAVALTSCFGPGLPQVWSNFTAAPVDCPMWVDKDKYQMHLTGILSLTPGDHGWLLDLLRADSGTFTGEAVWIHYSGIGENKPITRTINGVEVQQLPDAGYGFWQGSPVLIDPDPPLGLLGVPPTGLGPTPYYTVKGVGTADSLGFTVDFNWVYDNRIIKGWQVIPGMTFFDALMGNTPTLTANYLQGAKSMNFYVNFIQSAPTKWQAGVNYLAYWGNKQFLADRDFIGAYLTRNF